MPKRRQFRGSRRPKTWPKQPYSKAPAVSRKELKHLERLGKEVQRRELERVEAERQADRRSAEQSRAISEAMERDRQREPVGLMRYYGTATGRMNYGGPEQQMLNYSRADAELVATYANRTLRHLGDIEHIERTDFASDHYVSFISTPHPMRLDEDNPPRRYEVGIFPPNEEVDVRTFPTREAALAFYRQAVAAEQAKLVAAQAQARTIADIKRRQKKIKDRAIASLDFSRRRIRVRPKK